MQFYIFFQEADCVQGTCPHVEDYEWIVCDLCETWFHRKCSGVADKDWDANKKKEKQKENNDTEWFCLTCCTEVIQHIQIFTTYFAVLGNGSLVNNFMGIAPPRQMSEAALRFCDNRFCPNIILLMLFPYSNKVGFVLQPLHTPLWELKQFSITSELRR